MRLFFALFILTASFVFTEELPPGVKKLPDGNLLVAGITVRRKDKELAFPAKFNLPSGALEVIVAHPHGRVHEALLTTEIKALQVQTMLYLLGAKNGARLAGQSTPQGTVVDIFIEWTDKDGKLNRKPVENWIIDRRTDKPAKPIGWIFVGSVVQEGQFMADLEGNIVINYSVGSTILDIPDKDSLGDDTLHSVNTDVPVPEGVTLILKPRL